jgi:hypothetical protein
LLAPASRQTASVRGLRDPFRHLPSDTDVTFRRPSSIFWPPALTSLVLASGCELIDAPGGPWLVVALEFGPRERRPRMGRRRRQTAFVYPGDRPKTTARPPRTRPETPRRRSTAVKIPRRKVAPLSSAQQSRERRRARPPALAHGDLQGPSGRRGWNGGCTIGMAEPSWIQLGKQAVGRP